MKLLVDLLHPAHVHVFRNLATELAQRGHEVLFTARAKDITVDLAHHFGLAPLVLSAQRSGIGLGAEMLTRTIRLLRVVRQFSPDVMTGIMGPSIAVAGRAARVPSVVFYDTEFARSTNSWVYPMASAVCTPTCYAAPVRGRHVVYRSYHELAYLHPNYFEADAHRVASFGVNANERFVVLRFVSWKASHDVGEVALSDEQKRAIVDRLRPSHRTLISSEAPLPPDLEPLRIVGPLHDIHHLMAFAQAVVGESATMASEAAVLGVPAVYIAKTGRGYTTEQEERFGLVRHLSPLDDPGLLSALDASLAMTAEERLWRRQKLLSEKIDLTAWMLDYFENMDYARARRRTR